MKQRLSLVTLGVRDMCRAKAYYYDAIIIDPDGHPWEIAHNPGWTLTPERGVRLT